MSETRIDTAQLRAIASRILGDQHYELTPGLTAQDDDLYAGQKIDPAASPQAARSFLFGRSQVGLFHATRARELRDLLGDVESGYIAIANAMAAIAEDHKQTDEDAGIGLQETMSYFSESPTPR